MSLPNTSIKNYALHLLKSKETDDVTKIHIHIEKYKIVIFLYYFRRPFFFNIEYRKDGDDTWIENLKTKEEIELKNQNFVAIFLKDFKEILQRQKTVLEDFKIDFEKNVDGFYLNPTGSRIFRALDMVLKAKNLQAQIIDLQIKEMNEVKSILLNMDPSKLEILKLTLQNDDLRISEILEMDNLEKAKRLRVTVDMEMVTLEDLIAIKKAFFKFPTINCIVIKYQNLDKSPMNELFGNPYKLNDWEVGMTKRAIQIPNTNEEFLAVVDCNYKEIVFSRVTRRVEDRKTSTCKNDSTEKVSENMSSLSLNNKEGVYLKVFCNHLLMEKVLEYAQCFGIQRLRKVSRQIRIRVDQIKSDPQIKKIWIEWDDIGKIDCEMTLRNGYNYLLRYKQNGETCLIGEKFKIQDDYRSCFFEDLELCLKNEKSCLEEICLDIVYDYDYRQDEYQFSKNAHYKFLELFKETLKPRKPKLKVKKFNMEALCQNEVLEILPYLDPVPLKVIEIRCPYDQNPENPMEVNELSKLEQWIQAEELKTDEHIISTGIQEMNLTHFAKVEIVVNTISSEDIIFLKKELINSTSFTKFKITFKNCTVQFTIWKDWDHQKG